MTAHVTSVIENEDTPGVRQTYLVDGPEALFSIRTNDRVISLWPSSPTPGVFAVGTDDILHRAWTNYVAPFIAVSAANKSRDQPRGEGYADGALVRVAQIILASALGACGNPSHLIRPKGVEWEGLLVSVPGGPHVCPQRMSKPFDSV